MFIRRHCIRFLSTGFLLTLGLLGAVTPERANAASLVVSSNLDSGAGTLRQAMLTANSNGQADTITFTVTPVYNLTLVNSLPVVTEGNLTIDGTGTTAVINGSSKDAFFFNAVTGCAVRNITVAGANYGVRVTGGSGHTIEGMSLSGNTWAVYMENTNTNILRGSTVTTNTNSVVLSAAASNTIGGTTLSTSNRIAGHPSKAAIAITGSASTNNVIIGNRIGLNAAGTAAQANLIGININLGSGNRIGGTATGEANIISGNTYGIRLQGANCINTLIQGNKIGVADDGVTPIGNSFYGISLESSSNRTTVGGATAAHSNIIKANGLSGILVTGASTNRNRIQRNSIFQNTTAGITLTSGGNATTAAPVLTSPSPVVGTVGVAGTLQLYADSASQGETFIAESVLASSGAFSVTQNLAAYEGQNLTATITDSIGNTSPFSAPILIDVTPPSGSLAVDDPIVIDENALLLVGTPTDNFTSSANVDMRFSNDGITWSAWEPFASTKAWDLNFGLVSPTGGPRVVSLQYKDDSENFNVIPYTANIEIDITAPTGGLFLPDPVYTNPVVTLELTPTASDNNSALAGIEMRFSNDAVNWSPWEPYAATKSWDMNQDLLDTSDGNRVVLLQLRDEAGNVSDTYNVGAELDTTGPLVTSFIQLDTPITDQTNVRYEIAFNEPILNLDTGMNLATDDFNLIVSGLVDTYFAEIVSNGFNTYTILVETGTGDGTISVELLTANITDDHGNPLVAGQTSPEYVIDRLEITQDPIGGQPTEDDAFTFTVTAARGIGTYHYSWQKNGVPIPDAPDAASYTIAELLLSDTGSYTCVVSDDYVDVTSNAAQLDVQIRIPVASGAGLALLSGLIAAAFATAARRKKQDK